MSKTYIGLHAKGFGFDEAHLTLSYQGEMLPETEETINGYLCVMRKGPYFVERQGIRMFGENLDIPVVTVNIPDELLILKKTIDLLIEDKSDYAWNPHIALDMSLGHIVIPKRIELNYLDLY